MLTIEKLKEHASLPDAVENGIRKYGIKVQPCLFLRKAKRGEKPDGEYGGWPRLPKSYRWPIKNGEPMPFLGWLDLDRVAKELPAVSGSGNLLLFQHPEADENAVINHSATAFKAMEPRKVFKDEIWHNDGNAVPEDGKCYEKVGLVLERGFSVGLDEEIDDAKLERAIDRLRPSGVLGQIGGHLGVEHDYIMTCAACHLAGHGALGDNQEYWDTPIDELPEGTANPKEIGDYKVIEMDFSTIVERIKNVRRFLIKHESEVKEFVKENGGRWSSRYRSVIKKLEKLEDKYASDAVHDAAACNLWVMYVQEAHATFYRDPHCCKALLALPGYDPVITQERLDASFADRPKLPSFPRELCKQIETLARRFHTMDDSDVTAELQGILAEIERRATTEPWLYLEGMIGEMWRIPHNIACHRFHQEGGRDRITIEEAVALRKAREWKDSLGEEGWREWENGVLPWLSIFEASDWSWGDCGQRIYLSRAEDLQQGEFSFYHITLDFS